MISLLLANDLFDLYAPLLSARQREVLALYFQDDLSLSEIQEILSISKAAVYDALSKGVAAMQAYEEKLSLLARKNALFAYIEANSQAECLYALVDDPFDAAAFPFQSDNVPSQGETD